MKTKKTSLFASTFHRDGTITFWDVYQQQWRRQFPAHISDENLAAMSANDRAQTLRSLVDVK